MTDADLLYLTNKFSQTLTMRRYILEDQALEQSAMKQSIQRISSDYPILSLAPEETKKHIQRRLKTANKSLKMFAAVSYVLIYEYSGGVPA